MLSSHDWHVHTSTILPRELPLQVVPLPELFQRAWDVHEHVDTADHAQLQV